MSIEAVAAVRKQIETERDQAIAAFNQRLKDLDEVERHLGGDEDPESRLWSLGQNSANPKDRTRLRIPSAEVQRRILDVLTEHFPTAIPARTIAKETDLDITRIKSGVKSLSGRQEIVREGNRGGAKWKLPDPEQEQDSVPERPATAPPGPKVTSDVGKVRSFLSSCGKAKSKTQIAFECSIEDTRASAALKRLVADDEVTSREAGGIEVFEITGSTE